MKKDAWNGLVRKMRAGWMQHVAALKGNLRKIKVSGRWWMRKASRTVSRYGGWLSAHREAVGYYAVLTAVLAALGTAAYGYRNGMWTRETVDLTVEATPAPVLEAQGQFQPEATEAPPEMIWPVDGEIVGAFTEDELVWSDTMGMWQTHPGVDISAALGEAVAAAADGTVIERYADALLGNVIVIDHGEGRTMRYGSLNTLQLVEVGQKVLQGEVISGVGTCDCEAELEAHLHLEYYENGEAADPTGIFPQADSESDS